MACPAMYAAMAVHLHLPYWVVTGAGTYTTPMMANITQLRLAATQALRVAYGTGHGAGHGAGHAAGTTRSASPRWTQRMPMCGGKAPADVSWWPGHPGYDNVTGNTIAS